MRPLRSGYIPFSADPRFRSTNSLELKYLGPGANGAGTFFYVRVNYCDLGAGGVGGVDGVDAGGDSGCVDVAPEPVVLGGGVIRGAVLLLVVVVDEPLLAVGLLLFQPATIRNPISSNTATPAIQPHIPPAALSSRRITGSLSRGSVKRGSVMTFLHISRRFASSRNGETHQVWRRFRNKRGEAREPARNQVTLTANRQAAQKTKKKHARNTGKLAPADHCSTARPIR